jgi:hypothetical protein
MKVPNRRPISSPSPLGRATQTTVTFASASDNVNVIDLRGRCAIVSSAPAAKLRPLSPDHRLARFSPAPKREFPFECASGVWFGGNGDLLRPKPQNPGRGPGIGPFPPRERHLEEMANQLLRPVSVKMERR